MALGLRWGLRFIQRPLSCHRNLGFIATEDLPVKGEFHPDIGHLLKSSNRRKIIDNSMRRLGVSEEDAVKDLDELDRLKKMVLEIPTQENRSNLVNFATYHFPNQTHPSVIDLEEPKPIFWSNERKSNLKDGEKTRPFEEVTKYLGNLVRTENMAAVSTDRSYFLYGKMAEMEQALVRYTVDFLLERHNFKLVSVPDLLDPDIIKRCGMEVDGKRTQVFKLDPRFHNDLALSGTSEMAFGGLFMDKKIRFDAQKSKYDQVERFCAVSRCYRAEASKLRMERGIYRVHHFTKVEMFGIMPGDLELSNLALDQTLEIQKQLFEGLELNFKVLDMPPNELGNPAYRKYDIEALYPGGGTKSQGKAFYGEISSCSNCTDYQSRRLNIRDADTSQFVHTINGTACAVPRMIMAIAEQFQGNAVLEIPEKLRKYMGNETHIKPTPKKDRHHTIYIRSPNTIRENFKPVKSASKS